MLLPRKLTAMCVTPNKCLDSIRYKVHSLSIYLYIPVKTADCFRKSIFSIVRALPSLLRENYFRNTFTKFCNLYKWEREILKLNRGEIQEEEKGDAISAKMRRHSVRLKTLKLMLELKLSERGLSENCSCARSGSDGYPRAFDTRYSCNGIVRRITNQKCLYPAKRR